MFAVGSGVSAYPSQSQREPKLGPVTVLLMLFKAIWYTGFSDTFYLSTIRGAKPKTMTNAQKYVMKCIYEKKITFPRALGKRRKMIVVHSVLPAQG